MSVPARVGIVGGGVSGLHAAALLEARGIDVVLFESRAALGGRLLSEAPIAADQRFDLGGTWFWPDWQPELAQLIRALGLDAFEQDGEGDTVIDSAQRGTFRVSSIASSPPSLRLADGMFALVEALRGRLASTRVVVDRRVRRIRHAGSELVIEAEDALGDASSHVVDRVLLALPPRLAATTLELTPSLPEELVREWARTATWMASHAKYVAIYDEPFWRRQGLSGEGRSAVGPLAEVHDASTRHGDAALFGFFGVPAQVRARVSGDELRAHCRRQLVRMFGPQAASPKAELLKDWARDPHTATGADEAAPDGHPTAPAPRALAGPWAERVVGIASEWSPSFPGYIAGAIEAAERGVLSLTELDGR